MIKIPFHKQQTRYTCGPAVLHMAFSYFGCSTSEKTLAEEMQTSENGTSHREMIRIATEKGFFVYADNNSSFDEIRHFLKLGKPVIVNFIEPSNNEAHYAIVRSIPDHKVILNDPWNGENFSMSRRDFEKRWINGNARSKRWAMVVSDEKINFGKQYYPKKKNS